MSRGSILAENGEKCKHYLQAPFGVPSLPVKPLAFFSTSFLGTMIIWPQPVHFKRKSAPTRRISQSLLPQGCCFFNVTISPISKTIIHSPFFTDIYFKIPSISLNSSWEKESRLRQPALSFSCATLLAPIRTEVTASWRSTQARANCARD